MSLKIAFIDDGINTSRFSIPFPVSNILLAEENTIDLKESNINPCSHGTLCAAIFCKYAEVNNIELICLKVLNSELRGKNISLIEALEWCINNNISIVNCSVGTTNKSDFTALDAFFSKIKKQKITIVASKSNKNIYTYPACNNSVIGVKSSFLYFDGNMKIRWYPFDGAEVETSGVHNLILKDESFFKTTNANSFSAPVVTAKVANIIDKYGPMSVTEILRHLEKKATTVMGKYIFSGSPYPWHQNNIIVKKESYEQIIKKYIHKYSIPNMVPIIKVYGDNYKNEVEVIKTFESVLLKNGINYSVLSDQYDEMRLKYIFIPSEIDSNIFADNVFRNFECEIIIAHTSTIKADISIFVSLEKLMILYDDRCDCFLCSDKNSFIEAMEYVYNLLI